MPTGHFERLNMKRRFLFLALTVAFLIPFTSPAHASGSDELVQYLPADAKFVVGFNMDALRPAPIYKQMMAFLKQQPSVAQTLAFLESDAGFDVEKDIESVAVAFPEPVTSTQQQQTLSVVVHGTFEQEKLIEASKKRFDNLQSQVDKKTKRTHYIKDDFSFGFVGKNELVMTLGDSKFRDATWKAVKNKKSSAASKSDVKRVLGQINTERGVWIVGLTKDLPQRGPKMNSAGITIDVVRGLDMDMIANMASKEAAKTAATEMEGLKSQKDSPMVAMLGAAPLLENLKVTPSKSRINLSTSMTQAEFDTFITQLATTAAQGAQQTAPPALKGGAAPTDKKKGVDADFN